MPLLTKLIRKLSALLPADQYEKLVERLIHDQVTRLDSKEALRFLFKIDAINYALEGPSAVIYGDGKHPKHIHTHYHDFFVKKVSPGERVLDIGCGKGDVAYDVAMEGEAYVDGIDLSEENISDAKKRYVHPRLNFSVQDALSLDNSRIYDVVILSNVLEHLHSRPEFLKNIAELTGAKRFLIRVPAFERDWRVPVKKELGVEWRLDPDHKTEYTMADFEIETKEAGLLVVDVQVIWGEIWSELKVND